MPTQLLDVTQLKFSQLTPPDSDTEGYAYYCGLCDEILALSRRRINPRKVAIVFAETCPGCGFRLDNVMEGESSKIPLSADLFTNPKCPDAQHLIESPNRIELSLRKASMPNPDSKLTTGIETLDRLLELRLGQLAAINGRASQSLSSLLPIRAALPRPLGLDSDTVYLDGGNMFDSYAISEQAIRNGVDSEEALRRIHLSRAFTYHQLSRLINEKLSNVLERHDAKLVVVSDASLLYCDPDVQNKRESLDTFRKDMRTLANLAEQKSALILVTNLQTRNKRMDRALLHASHVSIQLDDRDTFTKLTLAKHPSAPQLRVTLSKNKQTLESYM